MTNCKVLDFKGGTNYNQWGGGETNSRECVAGVCSVGQRVSVAWFRPKVRSIKTTRLSVRGACNAASEPGASLERAASAARFVSQGQLRVRYGLCGVCLHTPRCVFLHTRLCRRAAVVLR